MISVTITQIFFSILLLFILSRIFIRFKTGRLPPVGFAFWTSIFGLAQIVVLFPDLTSRLASAVGIGRGADVIIYVSITLIFYLLFRLYTILEDIRHDITDIVREIAFNKKEENNGKNPSQN